MAMKKSDFSDIGYREYLHGLPIPCGASWQEMARAEGWLQAQAQERATAGAESTSEAPKKESEGGSSLKASEPLESRSQNDSNVERNKGLVKLFRDAAGITKREQEECGHNAIVSHIHFLRQEAMHIPDGPRRTRLINKADKLHFKHQYLIE